MFKTIMQLHKKILLIITWKQKNLKFLKFNYSYGPPSVIPPVVVPVSPPVIPLSPPVIPPEPSSCANTFSNAVGIPVAPIKANARIDVINIELIFNSISDCNEYSI
jgi:hypothetical protein